MSGLSVRLGCIVAAAIFTSGVALADSKSENARPAAQPSAHASRVRGEFVARVGDNCRYVANVRGSLQRAASTSSQTSEREFIPDLVIDARVTCPSSAGGNVSSARLTGVRLTPSALEEAIARGASVDVVSRGRSCTFTPMFAFADGELHGVIVTEACTQPSIGGGPWSL